MVTGPSFLSVAVPVMLAYLIGAVPFGYLFVRFSLGKDVRTIGSGNIGATNVQRTAGTKAGVMVLLLDILKGFVAVWLAALASHSSGLTVALAIIAVMLGHCYPIFLGFKGGKAVACFIGAFLYVAPLALLATAVLFLLVAGVSHYISLGSISGALAFPFILWLMLHPAKPLLIASIVAGILIVVRHRANIARMYAGTENVFPPRRGSTP